MLEFWKKDLNLFTFILALSLLLVGCGDSGDINACVARGISYYKEIGSYPLLQTDPNKGRKAEDVARERCQRTNTAF